MTVWATRADQVDLRGPNPHDLARSPSKTSSTTLMNSLSVSRTTNHQPQTNATQRCSPSFAELCCRDRMPNARSEMRSNTRANAVTPGRSSARWSEPPAKQPVSATAISKTHRPSGFGSVRDHSEVTHSCRIAGSLLSVDRSSADADDLKEVFESNKI